MKILFIAPRYHSNQHYWVKTLQQAGHQVEFWVRKSTAGETHELLEPRVIAPARGKGRKKYQFRSLLRERRPDAAVVRNPGEPFGRAALGPLRESGIPVVFYSQGPLYRRQTPFRSLAVAALQWRMRASWITPVLGGGRRSAERAPAHWHFVPFVMEPDPAAVANFETRPWCPGGIYRVLMVGKYMRRKNHLLLVQALHALSERYPVSLEIVGGGTRSDYRQVRTELVEYVRDHGLDWVTLTEPMPYGDLQMKMRNFDLFVLPSREEPVAVSLLEAMGKGLPVVCSTSDGAQDYVEHGGNGRIFESDSLEDLIAQLEVLFANPSTLPRLGRRSLELVRTVHSPERFLERFIPLVERK